MRTVVLFFCAILPAAALSAQQPAEDEAHRQDRLRTEALNRQAAKAIARRDRGNDDARADYDAARADYQRRLARWHAQVDACTAGQYEACDRR
jgi:hypothetical protein